MFAFFNVFHFAGLISGVADGEWLPNFEIGNAQQEKFPSRTSSSKPGFGEYNKLSA